MSRAGDALSDLRRRLAGGTPSAAIDAEILLAHVLGCSRTALATRPEQALTRRQLRALAALAERRLAGEPIAYLTGRREFWSLDLEVTREVLVPRPETELLVELALEGLRGIASPELLDLGTGSGAIALAIASERPDASVTAVDMSVAALAVAAKNAVRLGIGNVRFLRGSWYKPLEARRFHAIVANPPYVAEHDPVLMTLAYEPREALAAGPGGLDALAVICAGAKLHLYDRGALIVEHGAAQGPAVRALCTGGGLSRVKTHRDLAGLERATQGTLGQ
ncbi:MAG TPA: peptide chain release factor N(5)-glutamine methyltransferase [Steroidobacteraceae bacterium]|nr:peptide chain release factor N(5)-glutamine methyltransferase [Steroidobacteraceae bacterium]